jgi:uncharacterized protein YoxC
MEFLTLPFIMDVVIATLLIATIFYVARLSLYLKKFKENRRELQSVVAELSVQITSAERSVDSLNKAADEAGQDLQARLNRANVMFDELDIVVQTGDAMANRLERLAVKNRKIIEGGESDIEDLARSRGKQDYEERVENLVRTVDNVELTTPKFSIRDPEIERGEISQKTGFTLDDNEVLSDAERDLYETLQKARGGKK